jgi:hypothetical protein
MNHTFDITIESNDNEVQTIERSTFNAADSATSLISDFDCAGTVGSAGTFGGTLGTAGTFGCCC